MKEKERWEKLLSGRKWKKREWARWVKSHRDWSQTSERPDHWLPGEEQWFEGEDTWQEKNRRISEDRKEEMMASRERLRRLRELHEEKIRWLAYCEWKLKQLKESNQEESARVQPERIYWEVRLENQLKELKQQEPVNGEEIKEHGSEGHLLAHPDEGKVTLAGDHKAILAYPLSERACGDDLSVTEEHGEAIKEHGSEGHFPIHPGEVSATLAGGQQAVKAFTLSERVGEDDPSISGTLSSKSESRSE
jgi:hypothetical protein